MILHISVDELEREFMKPWKLELIKHISIDFATNALHGWFEDEDVVIFKFKNYGLALDNRKINYSISSGPAGITVCLEFVE